MADELVFAGGVSYTGLTVVADLYESDGTVEATAVATTEVGSTGVYFGDMPAAAADKYVVVFREGVNHLGSGEIEWDGTAEITETGTQADIAALNNLSAAAVNAEVDTALADYDAPTKAELDAAQASIEAAVSALNDLSAAAVNAEVDTALADYDAPTKAELDAAQASIEAAITALNNLSAAAVNAEVDTALADYNGPTSAELVAEIDAVQADIAALTAPDNANILLIRKLLANKLHTNPTTGVIELYDDDDTTVLLSGNLFEDIAGTQAYQGSGADRRDRMT